MLKFFSFVVSRAVIVIGMPSGGDIWHIACLGLYDLLLLDVWALLSDSSFQAVLHEIHESLHQAVDAYHNMSTVNSHKRSSISFFCLGHYLLCIEKLFVLIGSSICLGVHLNPSAPHHCHCLKEIWSKSANFSF